MQAFAMPQIIDRQRQIDIAYAIAITLVVVGHSLPTEWQDDSHPKLNELHRWIYSFHMPLFVFISGFVFQAANKSRKFTTFAAKRAQRILLPYMSANVIYFVAKWIYSQISDREFDLVFTAFLTDPDQSHSINLWFLPTIFWIGLALFAAASRFGNSLVAGSVIAALLIAVRELPDLYDLSFMGFDSVAHYAIYYWLGCISFSYRDVMKKWLGSNYAAPAALFGVHALALYFNNPLIVVASLGILATISLTECVARIPQSRLSWIVTPLQTYSYQIYLFSGIGMTPVRILLVGSTDLPMEWIIISLTLTGFASAAIAITTIHKLPGVASVLFGMQPRRIIAKS